MTPVRLNIPIEHNYARVDGVFIDTIALHVTICGTIISIFTIQNIIHVIISRYKSHKKIGSIFENTSFNSPDNSSILDNSTSLPAVLNHETPVRLNIPICTTMPVLMKYL